MPDVVPVSQRKHFVPITKVDATLRQVWGVMASETVDKVNDILDYASSKPYFEEWSGNFAKVTSGLSFGNVREMHQLSAVGKIIAIDFDDVNKTITIGTEIVDDAAWEKVEKCVYTGFSIGGKSVGTPTIDKDTKAKRYTIKPVEVSVVDDPCIGNATFQYIKADKEIEIRKFAVVEKSMYSISTLAQILASVKCLVSDMQYEADWENDGSTIPDALKGWLVSGVNLLRAVCEEESGELITTKANTLDGVTPVTRVLIVGANDAAQHMAKCLTALLDSNKQKINTGDNDMEITKAVMDSEIAKAVKAAVDGIGETVTKAVTAALEPVAADVKKTNESLAEIKKTADDAHAISTATAQTIAKLAGVPEEVKVAANNTAIEKVNDNGTQAAPVSDKDATATDLIKKSFGQPVLNPIQKARA
jgi:hypothetical protein